MGTVNSCCAGLRKEKNDQPTVIDSKSVKNSTKEPEATDVEKNTMNPEILNSAYKVNLSSDGGQF